MVFFQAAEAIWGASVTGTINWAQPTGITASNLDYGLNAYQGLNPAISGTPGNSTYKAHMAFMGAGLIRYQRGDEPEDATTDTSGWILNPTTAAYAWDATKISNALTGSFTYGPQRLLCIVSWPAYLDDGSGHLQTNDYGAFAVFCSNLVEIISVQMKYHIPYWEVLNEKDGYYWHNMGAVAQIYNQAQTAMRAADPTIQIGGPAFNSQENTEDFTQFIAGAYSNLDFISYHQYPSLSTNDSNTTIWNDAASLGSLTTTIKSLIANYTSRAIPTFFDEYNIDWQYATPSVTDLRMTNVDGAIFDALAMISIVNAGTTGAAAWCDANTVSGKMDLNYNLHPAAYLYNLFNTNLTGAVVSSSTSDSSQVVVFALNYGTLHKFVLVNRSGAAETIQLSFSGWGASVGASAIFHQEQVSSNGLSYGTESYATLTNAGGLTLPVNTITELMLDESALPPLPPSGLAGVSGNAQVALNWNPSTYATSYNVSRAAGMGGAYQPVASALTSANYTDTTVTNGMVYDYTVSAVNRNGASANSSPVSAMPWAPVAQISVSNGVLQAYCQVTQNQTCVLQSSTNLLSGWVPVMTNTATSNGNLILLDAAQSNQPQQFYRIKYGN
jgi:hypothetical protein